MLPLLAAEFVGRLIKMDKEYFLPISEYVCTETIKASELVTILKYCSSWELKNAVESELTKRIKALS